MGDYERCTCWAGDRQHNRAAAVDGFGTGHNGDDSGRCGQHRRLLGPGDADGPADVAGASRASRAGCGRRRLPPGRRPLGVWAKLLSYLAMSRLGTQSIGGNCSICRHAAAELVCDANLHYPFSPLGLLARWVVILVATLALPGATILVLNRQRAPLDVSRRRVDNFECQSAHTGFKAMLQK